MSPRTRALLAAVILALVGLVAMWWLPADRGDPVPLPGPADPTVRRFDVREPPTPRADREPAVVHAPPGPDSSAAAHARVAEALGLVAVRCWVGPELDSDDLVGEFHQQVEGGWYSHVESTLRGTRGVERRFEEPPETEGGAPVVDFETLFFVSWEAERPGQAVPCTVSWPRYATVHVRAVDAAGAPLEGAVVYGCRGSTTTDADGRATWEVFADTPCRLTAYTPYEPGLPSMSIGEHDLPALPEHAEESVVIELTPRDLGERTSTDDEPTLRERPADAAAWRAEKALFEEMGRDASGDAAALFSWLVRHRERMAAFQEESDARMAEFDAKMQAITRTLQAPNGEIDMGLLQEQLHDLTPPFLDPSAP